MIALFAPVRTSLDALIQTQLDEAATANKGSQSTYELVRLVCLSGMVLGLILVIWWCLVPLLRWRTTTYTITNRRLITRSGILSKQGKDLPLNRINEVGTEQSLTDRLFRCGSLNVQTAAEAGSGPLTISLLNRRRDLVKAGALIIAEIERLNSAVDKDSR